jgi:hypothetical protein
MVLLHDHASYFGGHRVKELRTAWLYRAVQTGNAACRIWPDGWYLNCGLGLRGGLPFYLKVEYALHALLVWPAFLLSIHVGHLPHTKSRSKAACMPSLPSADTSVPDGVGFDFETCRHWEDFYGLLTRWKALLSPTQFNPSAHLTVTLLQLKIALGWLRVQRRVIENVAYGCDSDTHPATRPVLIRIRKRYRWVLAKVATAIDCKANSSSPLTSGIPRALWATVLPKCMPPAPVASAGTEGPDADAAIASAVHCLCT